MSNNSFAQTLGNSWLMRCSVCGHYVGEHHDKGCSIGECDCGNGFYSMARDMRHKNLQGYIESFSDDTKIAILIGNSYHIFDILEATDLVTLLIGVIDVAKMTTIPESRMKCISCKENEAVEAPALIFDGLCKTCKAKWYNVA